MNVGGIDMAAEPVIHLAIIETLNFIAKKYGVQINALSIGWIESIGTPSVVGKLRLETELCPKRREKDTEAD